MTITSLLMEQEVQHSGSSVSSPDSSAFHYPRCFPKGRSVYTVISPRAHGLSIGVNLNPDRFCNFDCVYCEVAGDKPPRPMPCDVEATARDLEEVLTMAHEGSLERIPCYRQVPPELLQLREVTLSGDGEPTACPNFSEVMASVIRLRAVGKFPFFKIVLITNATGLKLPEVEAGLQMLTQRDEVWAKLDGGTQSWLQHINRSPVPLDVLLENILAVGRQRPIVIQSLFPLFRKTPPPQAEIDAYIDRLRELRDQGARINLVQIYSAHRPTPHADCGHLPLRLLSQIARQVRERTGLPAEVF